MRSKEEEYFSWYLDELKEAGFVSEYWYEPSSFILSEKITKEKEIIKQLKTKQNREVKVSTILDKHIYTPDFKIQFNVIPWFLESNDFIQNNIWWVDVKGTFNRHGGDRVFPINAKWTYQKYGILVEKIIPSKLFKETFTPILYLKTDKGKQERKIKWNIQILQNILKK